METIHYRNNGFFEQKEQGDFFPNAQLNRKTWFRKKGDH